MTEWMDASERVLVKYPLFKAAVARIQACFDSYGITAEPDCCPIVGESGSGKTTIISYFASLHPRVDHKSGMEVPVLLAKVPARPTVKSSAETLLYQLGDPLWARGNTVSKSIRLRELLKRCRARLLALDEFQHFVDVRQDNIPNDVADWLKEQVEETKLAIVVLGLPRCLEVLKQNEQLRRRFGATLRVGAFRWENKDDRTTYRAFLQAVQDQLPEYVLPPLADLDMAFRMHYASYGLIGYTMKIIRGAARIARSHPRREITLRTLAQSFAEHVWIERLNDPNPFLEGFDADKAAPLKLPSEMTGALPLRAPTGRVRLELHAWVANRRQTHGCFSELTPSRSRARAAICAGLPAPTVVAAHCGCSGSRDSQDTPKRSIDRTVPAALPMCCVSTRMNGLQCRIEVLRESGPTPSGRSMARP